MGYFHRLVGEAGQGLPEVGPDSRFSDDVDGVGAKGAKLWGNDMKWLRIRRGPPSPFQASEAGSVAVEFIILFPLFLLIVVGIVEFGHLWYVDHVITNASREGARAGVVYPNTTAQGITAANKAVTAYLYPNGTSNPSVIPGVTLPNSPNFASAVVINGGNYLQVQIQASNVALVLGQVVSAFQTMKLQATTTMRMEFQP